MKKVLSFVAAATLATAFVACGPSKAELEKKQKATEDSIAEAVKQDSIKTVEAAAAQALQTKQDSIKNAEAATAAAEVAHKDSVEKKLIKK